MALQLLDRDGSASVGSNTPRGRVGCRGGPAAFPTRLAPRSSPSFASPSVPCLPLPVPLSIFSHFVLLYIFAANVFASKKGSVSEFKCWLCTDFLEASFFVLYFCIFCFVVVFGCLLPVLFCFFSWSATGTKVPTASGAAKPIWLSTASLL